MGGAQMWSKMMLAGVALLFYSWFILMLVDYAPVSDTPQEWGSVQGDASALSGNHRYYLSNRYGYYHEWANHDDEREVGAVIKYNPIVDAKAQERGVAATVNGVSTMVGMGDRMNHSMRIASFGWFFFFTFIMYLASVRNNVREIYGLPGNLMEDFLISNFWPMALFQIEDQLDCPFPAEKDGDRIGDEVSAPGAAAFASPYAGTEPNLPNNLTI